ncbi:MAG: desulfoferrodoxin FeS4 iron-binding domain-containing protein [Deltaproteobacteria bacterium]|nr:desulfoferrodoxin FeS4 iron-binding domain-containing protein [Deltaproteobacteria bacterium]MBW2068914.1 desulfoferrodoxin FeS4 iron-binding domain-containing protein [Deltaproteobacteria bacterium]
MGIRGNKGDLKMAEKLQVYKCEVCRNVVEVLRSGSG